MAQIIRSGSSGSTVKDLQKMLNAAGYNLKVDGVFGSKTLSAVKAYQKANGLKVDGIVGSKTWGVLGGKSGSSSSSSSYLSQIEKNKPTQQTSKETTDAKNMLDSHEKGRPGEYESGYQSQIDELLNNILNRDKFSYDLASDPLYAQYKQQYTTLGNQAMRDTMGNAAAMTGGYGSSYASTAGNQAYQAHLSQLNNVVPELYNAAYDRYDREGQQMMDNLGLLGDADAADYGKYRDQVDDYYTDLQYYYTKYTDMSKNDYNKYLTDIDAWKSDRTYYYNKQVDAQKQSNWQKEYALKQAAAAKSSGGGSSKKKSSKKTTTKKKTISSSLGKGPIMQM